MAIKKKNVKGPEVDFTIPAKIIEDVELGNHLEKSFLEYAYLVILQRALPDARDGLIPSKRRILYTMSRLGLHHTAKHVKSARVVGEVMGIFHPHGSSYPTLVGMAQDFNMRVPLVDGHGNFGSVEDGPAADRYTEARLARGASFMLEEIKEDSVDMKDNYDGTTQEPVVLPAQFPNLLVNGSQGIAVGMANKMPPHNPKEIIDATRWLLKHPDATLDKLMTFVPAPDFPSAGIIIGTDGIKQAYETGRGKLVIRARHHIDVLPRGKHQIVFTEMPYEVGIESVIEKIKEGMDTNKIVGIADAKDLTDKDNGIMFVVETKAGINPNVLVEALFKNTPLELSYNINNTVITPDDSPAELGLKALLQIFIDFRIETVTRRTQNRLKKRNHRLHQIDALMRVLLDIDKAVALIRGSANPDAARTALMKHFKLDEEQADYVMNMQLRRLTKFDRLELENEKDKLTKEVVELNNILADRAVLISTIDNELKEVAKVLDVERKSEVLGLDLDQHIKESKAAAKVVSVEIADEPCFISLSHKGSIIRSAKAPRNTKSTTATTTRGRFIAITNKGNAFRIDALHVGEKAASAASVLPSTLPKGENVICLAPVALEDGKVGGLAMGTALGVVKVQDPKGFPKTQDEFSVISLADGDEIIGMRWVPDNTKAIFSFVSEDTSVLAFKGEACRPQGATSGGGIAGFKLAEGCKAMVFSVVMDDEMDDAVVITHSGDTGKMSKFNLFSLKGRATGGIRSQRMTLSDQSEKLAYAFVGTNPTLVNAEGNAIELPALDPRRDGSGKPFEGGVPVMV
jgi:DNA gyrase subunit A